jgi:hypothetical protein
MAATNGAPPAAVSTALDVRIHCALNIGRPLSAVRVEARLGPSAQVSAAVSADAGVVCFNAWGRLPVVEGADFLQVKVRGVLIGCYRGLLGGPGGWPRGSCHVESAEERSSSSWRAEPPCRYSAPLASSRPPTHRFKHCPPFPAQKVRERLPAVLGVVRMRSLYGRVSLAQLDPEAGWVERRVPLQPRGLQQLIDRPTLGGQLHHVVEEVDEEQRPASVEVRVGWYQGSAAETPRLVLGQSSFGFVYRTSKSVPNADRV